MDLLGGLNTARNELRKRKVRSVWEQATRRGRQRRQEEEPRHQARDLIREVYQLLDRLKVEERLVFILRHVEQHSLPEIAISPGGRWPR